MGADPNPTEAEIDRVRLEMQRQLERANAGFEEFISMAAHNLREPLRDVSAFSQLLAETHAGRLDSDAAAYLDRIRQGAASIQSVLAAVVDYWATGARDRQSSPTDMEAALCQALLRADKQIAARDAIVTHDPLPRVCGDFEILTKVLHHLIQNAIAYGDAALPRVHVACKRVSDGRSPCGTMVPVSRRHSRAAFSARSSASTAGNTRETDSDWHSARRPSKAWAAEFGWNLRWGRARPSISLCLPTKVTPRLSASFALRVQVLHADAGAPLSGPALHWRECGSGPSRARA